MVVQINTIIVGKELKVSKKDNNQYGIVTFMDGTNTVNSLVRDIELYNKIKLLVPQDVLLEINLGKYVNVELKDVSDC